jgi:cytochrome c oxidase assembly protein subunit 15
VLEEASLATDPAIDKPVITDSHWYVLLTAAIMTVLLIALGGVVCATESSQGCPDWPWCYGRLIPPLRMDSIIEYTHRLFAGLTSLLIVAAAVLGWRDVRSIRWVSWPPVIAILFLLAVSVFGALAVLRGLSPGLAAVDLGSALMVQALLLAATVVAFKRRQDPTLPNWLSFRSPFARLVLWTLVAVFAVLVSGVLVAQGGSIVRCLGWPLFTRQFAQPDSPGWPHLARHLVAGVTALLIAAIVIQAWLTQPRAPSIRPVATSLGVMFLTELAIGALVVTRDFSLFLLVTYVVVAAILWGLLVVLVVLAGLPTSSP